MCDSGSGTPFVLARLCCATLFLDEARVPTAWLPLLSTWSGGGVWCAGRVHPDLLRPAPSGLLPPRRRHQVQGRWYAAWCCRGHSYSAGGGVRRLGRWIKPQPLPLPSLVLSCARRKHFLPGGQRRARDGGVAAGDRRWRGGDDAGRWVRRLVLRGWPRPRPHRPRYVAAIFCPGMWRPPLPL